MIISLLYSSNILQIFSSGLLDEDDSGDDALTYQSSFHSSKRRKCAIPVPANLNQVDTEREANSLSIELGEPKDGGNQSDSFQKELEETSPAHEEDVESFSEELAELAEVAPSVHLSHLAETQATTQLLESTSLAILADSAKTSGAVISAQTADSTTSTELVAPVMSPEQMELSDVGESFEANIPSKLVNSVNLTTTIIPTQLVPSMALPDSTKKTESAKLAESIDLTTSSKATTADTCVPTQKANIARMKEILSSFQLPSALKIEGRRPSWSHAPMIVIDEENDDENDDENNVL